MSKKATLDGDITHRTVLVFMHPKQKLEKNPELIGMMIPDLLEFGPPTTKKGKPWIHVSTQIIQ